MFWNNTPITIVRSPQQSRDPGEFKGFWHNIKIDHAYFTAVYILLNAWSFYFVLFAFPEELKSFYSFNFHDFFGSIQIRGRRFLLAWLFQIFSTPVNSTYPASFATFGCFCRTRGCYSFSYYSKKYPQYLNRAVEPSEIQRLISVPFPFRQPKHLGCFCCCCFFLFYIRDRLAILPETLYSGD